MARLLVLTAALVAGSEMQAASGLRLRNDDDTKGDGGELVEPAQDEAAGDVERREDTPAVAVDSGDGEGVHQPPEPVAGGEGAGEAAGGHGTHEEEHDHPVEEKPADDATPEEDEGTAAEPHLEGQSNAQGGGGAQVEGGGSEHPGDKKTPPEPEAVLTPITQEDPDPEHAIEAEREREQDPPHEDSEEGGDRDEDLGHPPNADSEEVGDKSDPPSKNQDPKPPAHPEPAPHPEEHPAGDDKLRASKMTKTRKAIDFVWPLKDGGKRNGYYEDMPLRKRIGARHWMAGTLSPDYHVKKFASSAENQGMRGFPRKIIKTLFGAKFLDTQAEAPTYKVEKPEASQEQE